MRVIREDWKCPDLAWKHLWKLKNTSEKKTFSALQEWVVVRAKLGWWYPMCSVMNETIWDLFIDCSFAKGCWEMGDLWGKVDRLCYEIDDHMDLFLKII